MRVAIIGSRSVQLEEEQDVLPYLPENTTGIVSGGAEGADQIAEHIAEFLHVPLTVFRPDYARFQRRAPLERNRDIVQHADYVIALWDGSSRGTAHAIEQCIKEYKPVRVLICRSGKLIESVFDQSES
ncbi:MAG: hypothetical protein MR896_06665 [Clostridiales bacterium]|nr:hypothetical protein [Clostridiales bacterium]